jgi:tetratricopeptide (TPR) repeat protein
LQSLDEEEKQPEPAPAVDDTSMWLKSLEQEEDAPAPTMSRSADVEMPAWMKNIEQEETPAAEPAVPAYEAEPTPAEVAPQESELPSWLNEFDQEKKVPVSSNMDDLPAWLRDETGEVIAEPEKIEPTKPTDWKPVEEKPAEVHYSLPPIEPEQPKIIYSPPLEETPQPEPVAFEPPQQEEPVAPPPEAPKSEPEPRPVRKAPQKPAPAAPKYVEPVTRTRGTGMLVMPGVDPMLGLARTELSRSNIPGALESYGKLIKKGRFLEEVIYDLREALYRYPVEVSIWQSLGDAYMRANRLQDALDAYTKAEELLR